MKEKLTIKTILICTSLIVGILIGITFFEFLLLRLLGLQYQSVGSLVTFVVVYLFLEFSFSLITDNIPKALRTVGIVKSSKGLLSIILDIVKSYILILVIDYFMETIVISWQGILIFSLISGFIGWKLKENDEEPPMIDSKEFKELEEKINSKK
ncbi:TPA: hypothetical protein QCU53_005981 [Bacillus thuringiensis]|nr:hypothetical protein [Bacillus thuringiensis]